MHVFPIISIWKFLFFALYIAKMICADSDYLLLELKESKILNIGLGVFCKANVIPQGSILCEYRGIVFDGTKKDRVSGLLSYKTIGLTEKMSIAGNSIASYINDCVLFTEKETEEELKEYEKKGNFPIRDGLEYNCKFVFLYPKIFVVSIKDIKKGEELYASYGIRYWLSARRINDGLDLMFENNNNNNIDTPKDGFLGNNSKI